MTLCFMVLNNINILLCNKNLKRSYVKNRLKPAATEKIVNYIRHATYYILQWL